VKETADKPTREAFVPWISFLAAVQFLTVAPPIVQRPFKPRQLGQAVAYFPLVGLLLGGILAGGYTVLSRILPLPVTAVLTLALWVLLTGSLHLDGFLDACDGLFGGQTSERRLVPCRSIA
jgi:cobalamin synthase